MKRVHYTDSYLMNPQHPVTVNIIGAGGTGSQVLTGMARLDVTLRALGHPGLFVTVYDPDIVTDANIGRQLFGPSDLGLNKSQCLVTRIKQIPSSTRPPQEFILGSLTSEKPRASRQ